MVGRVSFVLALLVLSGCQWTPDRDSPFDPKSNSYVEPQPRNRPPVIGPIRITTSCNDGLSEDNCTAIFSCTVSDQDQNLLIDSVFLYMVYDGRGLTLLGPMNYDVFRGQFRLEYNQLLMPNGNIFEVISDTVIVVARDDSAAVVTNWTLFPVPIVEFPLPVYPQFPTDTVYNNSYPSLEWRPWSGDAPYTWSVEVWYENLFVEWDTSGLSPDHTTVTVTVPLRRSDTERRLYHLWYVTVVDTFGNRARSLPSQIYLKTR